MDLFLRDPRSSDYVVLAGWVPDARACARWAGADTRFPFAAQELDELLHRPGGRSRVLDDGNSVPLGFGQYWPGLPGEVHLGRIIVAPGSRGKGLGKSLCRLLMAEALERTGARAVTLRVYRDNPAALAVYAALGFHPSEEESSADVLFMRAQA